MSEPTVAFGDDGSPAADRCWRWIGSQRWEGWRLEVITTELPSIGPPPPPEETELHPWSPPEPRVLPPGTGFTEVTHLTARLDPRIALSRPVDLLAIGPRGPGLLKSLRLGSTAEWLLQRPPSPLVVARSGDPVRRVMVCHDGSGHADAATAAFARLPWAATATVTVLVVDDGRTDVETATTAAGQALGRSGAVDTVRSTGAPTPAILDEVERRRPDLVVLGTRGLTLLQRFAVGSTTATITLTSSVTVLLAGAVV